MSISRRHFLETAALGGVTAGYLDAAADSKTGMPLRALGRRAPQRRRGVTGTGYFRFSNSRSTARISRCTLAVNAGRPSRPR